MIGKLFTVLAVVAAVAVAEPCSYCNGYSSIGYGSGYRSIINSNLFGNAYPSRVLNVACSVPAVSTYPVGSPIATPAVLSPYSPTVATPVLATGVVRSRICGRSAFGGCRSELLSS